MMINSNNTVDLNPARCDISNHLDQQYLISNHPCTTMHADMAAHKDNSIYLSICSSNPNQYHKDSGIVISEKFTPNTKDKKSFEIMVNTKERVKVQHLEAPSKLQNNRWNFRSLCSLSDNGKEIMPNINNNNLIINQNESAFKNILNNIEESKTTADNQLEKSNVDHLRKALHNQQCFNYSKEIVKRTSPVCRTKDQENAFRRIEDVHNYSKLNRYSYSNGSSNSSVHEDDDIDEDEDCDNDDDDEVDDEDDLIDDEAFETYNFLEKKQQRLSYIKSNDMCANKSKNIFNNNYKRDINTYNNHNNNNSAYNNSKNNNINFTLSEQVTEISVDDGMAPPGENDETSNVNFRPDHHARRPMNAFLIFCKRHRAIVKDRYKTFENRAITKILGDWWASLDANEKKCYTNLAQQNKDAFFNANPNFKWYKLPAPPLRTLNTRPSNTERLMDQDDPIQDLISQHHAHHDAKDHVFKLADEAQMGDLSTLMSNKNVRSQHELQQALGETTQYLSIQIPDLESPTNNWFEIGSKRRLQNDNSFSSNSSEEDLLSRKSSRSCKGKIYQELVNSGQIAAITKKPKQSKYTIQKTCEQNMHSSSEIPPHSQADTAELFGRGRDSRSQISCNDTLSKIADKSKSTECSNLQSYDIIQFDLEEKIKELPALNLDIYLQRKRNTKKKKKINSKKRNSSSTSKSPCAEKTPTAMLPSPPIDPPKDTSLTNQAVGSRKRKARKESITRRDISLIENEVTSLLPPSDDFPSSRYDCYYFNDSQFPATAIAATGQQSNSVPALNNATAFVVTPQPDQFSENITNNISSTSDLFILAEVAAKRTEISN